MPNPGTWYFRSQGRGPVLLLLHGLGASSFSWRDNLGPLAGHFRVVAPDLPAHGCSPAPLHEDYRAASLSRGVMDFLDRQGIARAAVAGNSLGGGLALFLARNYPQRITALILLAPAAAMTRIPWIFAPLRLPVLGLLAAACLGPWIIPWILHRVYYRRELITPAVVAGYAAPYRGLRRRLALRQVLRRLQIPPLAEMEDLLRNIRQPVSLIWGEEDRILPVDQAHWIKARLPQTRLHLLPAVGHAPQEEAPAAVNKIIIDFLRH